MENCFGLHAHAAHVACTASHRLRQLAHASWRLAWPHRAARAARPAPSCTTPCMHAPTPPAHPAIAPHPAPPALQGNHIFTSGATGTNAAVIKGALRANCPDKLTVLLPQSLSKQPYESQELLSQVGGRAGGRARGLGAIVCGGGRGRTAALRWFGRRVSWMVWVRSRGAGCRYQPKLERTQCK